VPWRGVTAWTCTPLSPQLVKLEVTYRAWAFRRSLGPQSPARRGPAEAMRADTLFLALRGGGLGGSW
jgi:hypothetical protein